MWLEGSGRLVRCCVNKKKVDVPPPQKGTKCTKRRQRDGRLCTQLDVQEDRGWAEVEILFKNMSALYKTLGAKYYWQNIMQKMRTKRSGCGWRRRRGIVRSKWWRRLCWPQAHWPMQKLNCKYKHKYKCKRKGKYKYKCEQKCKIWEGTCSSTFRMPVCTALLIQEPQLDWLKVNKILSS